MHHGHGWRPDFAQPGTAERDLPNCRLTILGELTPALSEAHAQPQNYPLQDAVPIGNYVEETGERAGSEAPDKLVGVSNAGGLAPFKGKPAAETSRYRRLEPGDFVYNPMRVNARLNRALPHGGGSRLVEPGLRRVPAN